MQIPLDITFRDMASSPALVTAIEDWSRKLEAVCALQRCSVVIEQPHKHQRHGAPVVVHLVITIPGHEITVSSGERPSQADAYHAVADAFRAARRQLIEFIAQRREARPAI